MNQKEAHILVEIITKVVRKELGIFKKQLLQEGYTQQPVKKQVASKPSDRLTEVHRNFFKSNNYSQGKPLSKDPLINLILQQTVPIEESERDTQQELLENINLPVDGNGRVISSNAAVNHVIVAMNRDYSGMFKKDIEKKSPVNNTTLKTELRSKFKSIMEGEVTPFSDDEDLRWLDGVE